MPKRKKLGSIRPTSANSVQLLQRLDQLEALVTSQTRNAVRQLEAFWNIQRYLATGQLLPDFHGWPVCPDFALYLLNRLETQAYDLVVEFGSGTSTWLVAHAQKRRGFQFLSFEHSDFYLEQTKAKLKADGLLDQVSLHLTPLKPLKGLDGNAYEYYDCNAALTDSSKQLIKPGARLLVVVDGPPAATGPHARYPALQCLLDNFPTANIDFLLDDYIRVDEQEILQMWMKHLADLNISYSSHILRMEKDAALLCITRQ